MDGPGFSRAPLLCGLVLLCCPAWAAQPSSSAAKPGPPAAQRRDGQRDFDFDFEIGTWRTHLKRRQHPLTGSNTWVEYTGTTPGRWHHGCSPGAPRPRGREGG